jgi:hypothetical protein
MVDLVPASVVAKCAGVDPDRRRKWAQGDDPLVRPGPGLTDRDAVETAILAALARANQKVAPEAWRALRQDIRKLLIAGADDLWVLMSATGLGHGVAEGAEAAAVRAAESEEAYHVIGLKERIVSTRARYSRMAAKPRAPRSALADLGGRRSDRGA